MLYGFCLSLIAVVFLCGLAAVLAGIWRSGNGSANAPLFWVGLGLFFTGLVIRDLFAHPALPKDVARLLLGLGVLSLGASLLDADWLTRRLARFGHGRWTRLRRRTDGPR